MLKRLLPVLICAFLALPVLPARAVTGTDVVDLSIITPDMLGTKIVSEIFDNTMPGLRIETKWPVTLCIAQKDLRGKHIDATTLTFSAMMKGRDVQGSAYLEMYLHVPGSQAGAYFARGLQRPLSTVDTGWEKYEASFQLAPGQVPDQVTLNLVFQGTGTIWVKDIHVQRYP
jgi:hypothetical protein